MNINNLQSLIKSKQPIQRDIRTFKAGQIVQGKVERFFPKHVALVQIGKNKIYAQLETALQTDKRYWFQVQQNDQLLELKVIDKSISQNDNTIKQGQANQTLLKQFGIALTKENQLLIQHLTNEGLPFTKENLKLASEWLKSTNDVDKALRSIQTMLERNLPFTKTIFQSLTAYYSDQPISTELKELLQQLNQMNNQTSTTRGLQLLLTQLIGKESTNFSKLEGTYQLLEKWVNGTNDEQRLIQSIFRKLGVFGEKSNEKVQAELTQVLRQLLTNLKSDPLLLRDTLPELLKHVEKLADKQLKYQTIELFMNRIFANNKELQSSVNRIVNSFSNKPLTASEAELLLQIQTKPSKEERALALIRILFSSLKESSQQQGAYNLLQRSGITPLSMSTNEAMRLVQQHLSQVLQQPSELKESLGQYNVNAYKNEKVLIQNVLHAIETDVTANSQKRAIELLVGTIMKGLHTEKQPPLLSALMLSVEEVDVLFSLQKEIVTDLSFDNVRETVKSLRQIFSLLGLNHENVLFRQTHESVVTQEQLQNMKALLLRMNQENLPQPIQERAEQLLQRLTGQQLISLEQNGPIQHSYMQIPLTLGRHSTDLHMQWSGRKRKNGKIDSEFCRVLFYLNLEHLKQTVVDMKVQQRVMSIEIYNETEQLDVLTKLMEPLLKENLEKLGYILSHLKVIKPKDERNIKLNPHLPVKHPEVKMNRNSYTGVDFKI